MAHFIDEGCGYLDNFDFSKNINPIEKKIVDLNRNLKCQKLILLQI